MKMFSECSGYTWKVVVAGNCVSCGKHINGDNIFLCKDCQSKQNAERKDKAESEVRIWSQ